MRFIKSAIYIFLSIVIFLVAIFLIMGGFMALDEQFMAVVIYGITHIHLPGLFILGGVGLFFLSLIFYGLAGRGSRVPTTYSFNGANGPITISLRAIEDFITKSLEDRRLANNVRTRVGVSKDRKKLVIRAGISASSEQSLKDVGERIQRDICLRLKEGLGLENVERVVVSVDKIVTSRAARTAASQSLPDNS
jgi:uncharacterized alkaline shock family protein YloU